MAAALRSRRTRPQDWPRPSPHFPPTGAAARSWAAAPASCWRIISAAAPRWRSGRKSSTTEGLSSPVRVLPTAPRPLAPAPPACQAMGEASRSGRQRGRAVMRRMLMLLLKAAISGLLLYLSLRAVNLAVLGERLSRLHAGWLGAAVGILAAQTFLLAARWRLIAEGCGIAPTFSNILRISFIATFFNQVLPSTVGGDAARIWMLARDGGGWAAATYSVLLARVAGIIALTLIVFLCLPWTLTLVQDPVARIVLVLIGASAIAGSVVLLAIGHIRWKPLMHWPPTRHLVEVSRTAWRICGSRRALGVVAASSIVVNL